MAQALLQDEVVQTAQEHVHRETIPETLRHHLRPLVASGIEHALNDSPTRGAVYRPLTVSLIWPKGQIDTPALFRNFRISITRSRELAKSGGMGTSRKTSTFILH